MAESPEKVAIMKYPTAWLPIVLSLAALAVVLVHVAIYGIVHEKDEGAAAHIFQLLMAAQVPVIVFFAVKWVPRAPRQSLQVLAVQFGAALFPLAGLYFLIDRV